MEWFQAIQVFLQLGELAFFPIHQENCQQLTVEQSLTHLLKGNRDFVGAILPDNYDMLNNIKRLVYCQIVRNNIT